MINLRWVWPVPAIVGAVALVALVPITRSHGPGPGEALVTVSGRARVVRANGEVDEISGHTRLRRGDSIELERGLASFELADGVRYEGHSGGAGRRRTGTTVRMDRRPSLEAGELLVTAEHSAGIESGGTAIDLERMVDSGDGGPQPDLAAMRLTRTIGLRIGVYRGRSSITSDGEGVQVPALRRLEVAGPGELPQRPVPLRYRNGDRWDRRFLGDAVALDRQLGPLLGGLRAATGPGTTSARYLRSVLPKGRGPVELANLTHLVEPGRRGDESLVGSTIAALGAGPRFDLRWRSVFAFRDDGAMWGLVALDQAVGSEPVLAALRDALNRTAFSFRTTVDANGMLVSAGPGGSASGPSTTTGPTGGAAGGGTTGGGGSPPGVVGGPGVTGPASTTPPAATTPGVTGPPRVTVPPVATLPRSTVPPITVPPVTIPPITVTVPPVTVTVPPVTVTIPPITIPPITLPFEVR